MATKAFKRGQKVKWKSHAGGKWLTKTGTVVEVCREPQVNLTRKTAVKILREASGNNITVAKAREKAQYMNLTRILQEKYKLKFNPIEGRREDVPHYLVEVERGSAKPYLYHPLTKHLTPAE